MSDGHFSAVLGAAERRRNEADRIARNGAATMQLVVRVRTAGIGESLTKPIVFPIAFLDKPVVHATPELEFGSLTATAFPQVTAGVASWQQDARGNYTGASLFIVVDTNGVDTNYTLLHHFSFRQTAVRLYAGALLA